jgi:putative transposase
MIDREHPLSVTRQARLLEISRGAVYYQPRPTSEADLAIMRRIDELHLEHPFMGARMMRRQLQRQSIHVGRRHLTRRSKPPDTSSTTHEVVTCHRLTLAQL